MSCQRRSPNPRLIQALTLVPPQFAVDFRLREFVRPYRLCHLPKISRSIRRRKSSQSEVTASPASTTAHRRSISVNQASLTSSLRSASRLSRSRLANSARSCSGRRSALLSSSSDSLITAILAAPGRGGDEGRVNFHVCSGAGMPRSRQILRTNSSLISGCRGTAERRHRSTAWRFIPQYAFPRMRRPRRRAHRRGSVRVLPVA